jgi:hypothetical protein
VDGGRCIFSWATFLEAHENKVDIITIELTVKNIVLKNDFPDINTSP